MYLDIQLDTKFEMHLDTCLDAQNASRYWPALQTCIFSFTNNLKMIL